MTKLESRLATAISQAFVQFFDHTPAQNLLALQPTRKEFAGTFTFVTFPFTKPLGQSPDQIGQAIGQHLKERVEPLRTHVLRP